jgi:hypothetical protein
VFLEKKQNFAILEKETSYFYFSPKNEFDNDIILKISVNEKKGAVDVFLKLEGSGVTALPSKFDYDASGNAREKNQF